MRYGRILIAAALVTLAILPLGCSLLKSPWKGTWWGVQDAGINWSGDDIRNLETFTFSQENNTISIRHQVQVGSREIPGDLNGSTASASGSTLTITPKSGAQPVTFSYDRGKNQIATSLTNADNSPVYLQPLTDANKSEMENIRAEIISVAKKSETVLHSMEAAGRTPVAKPQVKGGA